MTEKSKILIFSRENHYLAPKYFLVTDFIDLEHSLYSFHHGGPYFRCTGSSKMAQNLPKWLKYCILSHIGSPMYT